MTVFRSWGRFGVLLLAGLMTLGVLSACDGADSQAVPRYSMPDGARHSTADSIAQLLRSSPVGCEVRRMPGDSSVYCLTSNNSLMEVRSPETASAGSAYLSAALANQSGPVTVVAGPDWLARLYDDDDQAAQVASVLGGKLIHGGVPMPYLHVAPPTSTRTFASIDDLETLTTGALSCARWQGSLYYPRSRGCADPGGFGCVEIHLTTSVRNRDDGVKYEFGLIGVPAVVEGANWYVAACNVDQARRLAIPLGGSVVLKP
ncbi:MAG TPA: hypothetical protein VFU65_09140 [Actinocrinis sp.]|nr:hypothetical protein [Actinocrinis sp.]